MKTIFKTLFIVLLSIGMGVDTHLDGGEINERYEVFFSLSKERIIHQKSINAVSKAVRFPGEILRSNHPQVLATISNQIPETIPTYLRNCCFLN